MTKSEEKLGEGMEAKGEYKGWGFSLSRGFTHFSTRVKENPGN
jgi:hypothetical protein